MNQHSTQLLQAALRLSESERADLTSKLLDSLDPAPEDDAEAAWSLEIQQRIEELRTGQTTAIPWSQARTLIMDDLDDASAD